MSHLKRNTLQEHAFPLLQVLVPHRMCLVWICVPVARIAVNVVERCCASGA